MFGIIDRLALPGLIVIVIVIVVWVTISLNKYDRQNPSKDDPS